MSTDKKKRDKKSKIHITAPFIMFLLLALIYGFPISRNIGNWGHMDWDQYTFWNAVPRETILRHHQFPLWNPYSNGGNVLLALPQSPFLTPFYIPVLIFGPIIGLKLEIIIHLLVGMLGMFLLSKYINSRAYSSYLPPIIFMLSSIYTLHLAEGHMEWSSMAFVPWLFLFYLKSLEYIKYVIGSILSYALMIFGGSVYIVSISIISLSVYSIFVMFQTRKLTPLKVLGSIFIGAFLVCSVKLIPMLEFLKDNPRKVVSSEATDISLLPAILLSRDQAIYYQTTKWTKPGQKVEFVGGEFEFGWHEYGAYTGFVPLLLATIGIFFYFKTYWPLLLTGMVSLWMSLGRGAFYNLWGLVHRLPLYDSLHVPSRFIVGFIFSISLFSGLGLSKLEGISRKKYFKFLIGLIVGFVFFDLFLVDYPLLKAPFIIKPPEIIRYAEFRHRYRDFNLFPEKSRSSMYPVLLSNSGIINSYEVIGVAKGDIKAVEDYNYRGEVYFLKTNNKVESVAFSPNRLKIKTDVKEQDFLIVNQNFHRGWRVKVNKKKQKIVSSNGLVSVNLPPGNNDVTLYYLPKSFIAGMLTTLVTCIILVTILWKINKYQPKSCGRTFTEI